MNGDLIAIDKICSDVIAYDPIPLTEEILKANGFEYREFTSCESMHYDHSATVYLNKDREVFMLIGGEQRWLEHVHQLQHALRLCGLNDLADNFKVVTADGVPTPTSAPNK